MAIGKEDFEAGVYGSVLQQVLQCLPDHKALSYLDIRKHTGLGGKELDDALADLEKLRYIQARQLGGGMYYLRRSTTPQQEWYTLKEAELYLRVSRRSVYQLLHDGQLASYRLGKGGHRRFRREDLERVMQREQVSAADAVSGVEDSVLADLWINEKDATYDQI